MRDNIIRFPGTDEVEPEGIGAGHVPLVRFGHGVDALSIGGMVNALAALAQRAQRRRGTVRRSTNNLLAAQGLRELVVERDPQTHDVIFTARYLDDEEERERDHRWQRHSVVVACAHQSLPPAVIALRLAAPLPHPGQPQRPVE